VTGQGSPDWYDMPASIKQTSIILPLALFLVLGFSGCKEQQQPQASAALPADAVPSVAVTVTSEGCQPASLTVAAGKTRFMIHNASARALEWEILKGVYVVEERENIAPGFTQKLTATLEPGNYEITCGLLSNPRGKLTVTAR
jgi:iron uptake system EfeUOB component EfeO/EfeM